MDEEILGELLGKLDHCIKELQTFNQVLANLSFTIEELKAQSARHNHTIYYMRNALETQIIELKDLILNKENIK